jgi:hypothetical protein
MAYAKSDLMRLFNNHFGEFLEDINNILPGNSDILSAKKMYRMALNTNPNLIIKIWGKYVATKYQKEIESGNIQFFLKKNYECDVINSENASKTLDIIQRLKKTIELMSENNQKKAMKYIQNLTQLTVLYDIHK